MTYLIEHGGYLPLAVVLVLTLWFVLLLLHELRRHNRTLDPGRDLWVAQRAEEEEPTLWERVKDGCTVERVR